MAVEFLAAEIRRPPQVLIWGKIVLAKEKMQLPARQTNQAVESLTVFQRIAGADKTAVEELVDRHGNLVWALAKKFTASREEAEAATQEIFLDLWKTADRFDATEQSETDFVLLIACRRLLKSLRSDAADLKVSENVVQKHTDKKRAVKFGFGELR